MPEVFDETTVRLAAAGIAQEAMSEDGVGMEQETAAEFEDMSVDIMGALGQRLKQFKETQERSE